MKETTKYKVGQDNLQKFGLDVHNPVFAISAILILVFVIGTLASPKEAKEVLDTAKWWAINNFDWLFMLSGNFFVIFCLILIVLPVGKIRLGGDEAKPEFTNFAWFSMLFAAGMGIGLMYWSVAEPVAYYTGWWHTPLNVIAKTPEAKDLAMGATMYHWGLHPWAIYAVVGLSLAFFSYSKKLPLTMRSAFYPILKEKVWGWPGHIIDLLAVFATIFGLATSLGLGAQQVSSGLKFLFDIDNGVNTQIWIIAAITVFALISVVRGLEGGVKVLSKFNILLALFLVLFIIVVGPTLNIITGVGTTLGNYASNIFELSNFIGREDSDWFHGWTVFYWAWWIAWSPFVGMFIARVSKGRTVREFIIAVLLIPTVVTSIWMSTFGLTALDQVIGEVGALAGGISDKSLAMFQMLENLPFATITSSIAIFLVIVFFVTSSDSGSLVIDSITAGGKVDAPVKQRAFWAILEGLVAIALLYVGGSQALDALQAGSITTALPFTVILLGMCYSLYIGLKAELKVTNKNK
ncbi:BCCT family transporter [Poseidonibacter lekithochrous]|uniref:BCCT family transporter n=1 Tax=Poseidonibacter lekithochrous TaxID=1904463 RepID=UPI0008FC5187|nr:BCCT family transporter [Poseidonibacter lekithochrous]QKJ22466.1 BCCT (betaine/carnitine/choline) family transporter [Poseidonibacter lekithochrous]